MNRDDFINKAIKIHGNKYDYSKVIYKNTHEKVCIICPEHGEFLQTPHNHLQGKGCPICAKTKYKQKRKLGDKEFIERAKKVHGNKYDYSKVNYINLFTKVCIICPEHGEFLQLPSNHLKGKGCPICGNLNKSRNNSYTFNEFVTKACKVHGDKYQYNKELFKKDENDKIGIICPKHGIFRQTITSHLLGNGCPMCAGRNKTNQYFINEANNKHHYRYDYSQINYINSQTKIGIICPKHGLFWQTPNNHLNGEDCPKCSCNSSKLETELFEFIKNNITDDVVKGERSVLNGKEIDIYSPSYKIGIEFNGLYWHNESKVDRRYHLNKTNDCAQNKVRLIHIFEDEWVNKNDIVKSMLLNAFGKTSNRIYARKCIVKEISSKDKRGFINKNHIQGDAVSSINLGLYYNDELVSVMTFCKERINLGRKHEEKSYELLRFCSKLNTSVIGGASKLFKHFIELTKPNKVVTYSDNRWAKGATYEKLGFNFIRNSEPNYFYIVNGKRENRFKYRKDKLVSEGFDKNKSEHEIMIERGIYRIYDCGCKVWQWINDKKQE